MQGPAAYFRLLWRQFLLPPENSQRILNSHVENSATNWFSFRDRASRESIGARANLKLEP
jgi:hypothetical protein